MYLSRIELNIQKPACLKAMASPSIFHGIISASDLKDAVRRKRLWRIDHLNGKYYLLVLSEEKLDLDYIAEQVGYLDPDKNLYKQYDSLLDRINEGDIWTFRLRANPVHSVYKDGDEGRKRGRILSHATVNAQMQWLVERSEKNGFKVTTDSFTVMRDEWKMFTKNHTKDRVKVLSVDFEGTLIVTDKELFKQALVNGIGRGKAYGNGLMTIIHQRKS